MKATPEMVEYWQQQVSSYQSSGLSRREYCQQNQIKIHRLDYWQRRLKKPASNSVVKKQGGWIPLQVGKEEKPEFAGGIHLRIGRVVFEVESGFDSQLLAEVLRVVRSTC